MGLFQSTSLVAEGFCLADVAGQDIRFAFRFQLPFRLRFGGDYNHQIVVRNRQTNLYLRNKVAISPDAELHRLLSEYRRASDLFTQALVVVENPEVSDESLRKLRSSAESEEPMFPRATSEVFTALQALNQFVIAYATATGELFGGAPLKVFRTHDFFTLLQYEITIVGFAKTLSKDDLNTIFNLRPDREFRTMSFTGELFDLEPETIELIGPALALQRDFVFYEYAFESKAKMIAGDYTGALLMAITALEGAHAAFVEGAIRDRLPQDAGKNLPGEYLHALGMTLCNQLTPYLFMNDEDRPTREVIQGVATGIKYRNEIIHSTRSGPGQYRSRLRTNEELSDACSSVLKAYECYRVAVEKSFE